jgi:hypothetical protein
MAAESRVAAVQGAIVATVGLLIGFVFRLGFLLPIVWLIGALVTIWLAAMTGGGRRAVAVAVASYAIVTIILFYGPTNQQTSRTFEMTWRATGGSNEFRQPELRLEFAAFPGNYVLVYSSALADHLKQTGSATVPVDFIVHSDYWCVGSFELIRINGRGVQELRWLLGAVGSEQGSASPWGTLHWWCRLGYG